MLSGLSQELRPHFRVRLLDRKVCEGLPFLSRFEFEYINKNVRTKIFIVLEIIFALLTVLFHSKDSIHQFICRSTVFLPNKDISDFAF